MRRYLSMVLVAAIFSLSTQSVQAKVQLLPTMDVMEEASIVKERTDLMTFMKTEKVQKEMVKHGVDPQEALKRVASLSNEEVRSLSTQISKAQAGGDFGVGSIVGAVLFVFIVLLITDILGFTKVFPFTRSVN